MFNHGRLINLLLWFSMAGRLAYDVLTGGGFLKWFVSRPVSFETQKGLTGGIFQVENAVCRVSDKYPLRNNNNFHPMWIRLALYL